MNKSEFEQFIRAAMDRLGITQRTLRAAILSFATQECILGGGYVSVLAARSNNLFGIKYNDSTDRGRYLPVTFDGNQFDKADGLATVQYRTYNSFDHCISNWMSQMFASSYREECVRAMFAAAAGTWCQNNKSHVEEVMTKYDRYLEKERG